MMVDTLSFVVKSKVPLRLCLLVLLLSLFGSPIKAINPPVLQCPSVLGSNVVSLSYQIPPDPANEFTAYLVYYASNPAGPYSLGFTESVYSASSVTFPVANPINSPIYMYMVVQTSSGISLPSDTIATLFLNVSNPGDGRAALSWNGADFPSPSLYSIIREYPPGTPTVRGTTTQSSYKDTIDICQAHLDYVVALQHPSGCLINSNKAGGDFVDGIAPSLPILDSISVDAAGNLQLGLSPSSSPDAVAYIIYYGSSDLIYDTVWSSSDVLFPFTGVDPNQAFEYFSIAALDSCGKPSTHAPKQSSICLKASYAVCPREVKLTWNAYQNLRGGVKEYRVFMSENGGAFSLIATVTGTSYSRANLTPNVLHSFYVQVVNFPGTISASSNRCVLFTRTQKVPNVMYLSSVSVMPESQTVAVGMICDSLADLTGLELFYSLSPEGPYNSAGVAVYNDQTYQVTFYEAALIEDSTYYFYVKALDSCGQAARTSNVSKSVLLKVTKKDEFVHELNWDFYSSYSGGVESYQVFRGINGVWETSPLATLANTVFTYTDSIVEYTNSNGVFMYYIKAIEGDTNLFSIKAASNSNTAYLREEDQWFIPNAFVPKGYNKVFKPIGQFVSTNNYNLSIYDRFGEVIWSSTDKEQGWDGVDCAGGVYVYLISYQNAYGEYKQVKGIVHLIR